ncbi:hypothetical protein V2G26_019210 [Clonostachys chloroleuca]
MKSLYTSSCTSVRQQLHGALPRQWDNALSSHQLSSPSVFSSQRTSFLGNEPPLSPPINWFIISADGQCHAIRCLPSNHVVEEPCPPELRQPTSS